MAMTTQITILNTNAQADGSFNVSGVFWLVPSGSVGSNPNFKSQVANPPADVVTMLRVGTLIEEPFTTGLFAGGTVTADVRTTVQDMYASAQAVLTAQSVLVDLVGTSFDGASWNAPITGSLTSQTKIGSQYTHRT